MKSLLLLMAAAISFGCAQKEVRWNKPGATQQEFSMDQGQCRAQAFAVPLTSLVQRVVIYEACMQGRGYSPD